MQFGARHQDFASWELPPEDTDNRRILALSRTADAGDQSAPADRKGVLRIGLSTWGNKVYRGTIYPPSTQPRDYLAAYGRRFSTVELSSTFYGMPPEERLAGWAAAVPADFRFLPKISRTITHRRRLKDCSEVLADFVEAVSPLGDRLGPLFLQLPPSFAPGRDNLRRLSEALSVLGEDTAVELRHPDWFRPPTQGEVASLLRDAGASWVVTDTPGAREVVHGVLTTPQFVLRFVAAGVPEIDAHRADSWIDRVGNWFAAGLTEAFVYIHYDNPAGALGLIGRFTAGLVEKARIVGSSSNPSQPASEQPSLF